jgi:hypothetical protein
LNDQLVAFASAGEALLASNSMLINSQVLGLLLAAHFLQYRGLEFLSGWLRKR